jgi:hypothetical protein
MLEDEFEAQADTLLAALQQCTAKIPFSCSGESDVTPNFPVSSACKTTGATLPRRPPGASAAPRKKTLYRAVALALLCLPAFGCQPAMSTSSSTSAGQIVANEFPLKFENHNFEAHCYNATDCEVIYANTRQLEEESGQTVSPQNDTYKKNWGGAPHIGIRNFPGPAVARWTSVDGQMHEARVDLELVFKNNEILHEVPKQEIPDGAHIGDPTIILEINDRTINVYMKAFIPTKEEQTPGNKHSYFVNDLVLAWSKTY